MCYITINYKTLQRNNAPQFQITPVYTTPHYFPGPLTVSTEWSDEFTGEKFQDGTLSYDGESWTHGTPEVLELRTRVARESYINDTIKALRKDANDPPNASATWKKLVNQPLPVIE